ncbi:hypothetical protein HBB16_01270 [Pseudonocardia sp. MCCB 268]|nr:hypothetical protein [Pseudonocardia cytotoxica]
MRRSLRTLLYAVLTALAIPVALAVTPRCRRPRRCPASCSRCSSARWSARCPGWPGRPGDRATALAVAPRLGAGRRSSSWGVRRHGRAGGAAAGPSGDRRRCRDVVGRAAGRLSPRPAGT